MVFNLAIYPFKTKKIYTGLESFIGITVLKSKGSMKISEYDVDEGYSNNYSYLNYGFTQTVGYYFGGINIGAFSMLSLKGVLDEGRTRPGDAYSQFLEGAYLNYKIESIE